MPGTLSNADINFPSFTGSTEKQLQEVESYLYMLLENLRYSLANIGTENMNSDELDKIIKMSAEQIDLTGYVTFNSLAEEGQTIINGSNITTGTISASRIDADNLEVDAANVSGTLNSNVVSVEGLLNLKSGGTTTARVGGATNAAYFSYGASGYTQALTMMKQGSYTPITQLSNNSDTLIQLLGDDIYVRAYDGGIYLNGESISLTSSYDPIEINGSGTKMVMDSGNYWEFDGTGLYYCSSDGTRVSQVVMESV